MIKSSMDKINKIGNLMGFITIPQIDDEMLGCTYVGRYDADKINNLMRGSDSDIDAKNLYYSLSSDDYLYVLAYSGRTSALKTSMLIANHTKHKLKDIISTGNSILTIYKRSDRCNDWVSNKKLKDIL